MCRASRQNMTVGVFANWGLQGDYGLFCTITNCAPPPATALQYRSKLDMLNYTATSPKTLLPALVKRFKAKHDSFCFCKLGVPW